MMSELSPLAIPDFPGFIASLTDKGYSLNPCRDHCPDKADEHAHLRTPDGDDMIVWADGRWSGYDLTQPARCIYPAAPAASGAFRLPFRNDGGVWP
jgi:hypothetical protein